MSKAFVYSGNALKSVSMMDPWADWNDKLGGEMDTSEAYRSVAWLYRCVELRANALSAMPFGVFNKSGGTVEWPLSVTLPRLLYLTEVALCLRGSAYWLREKNRVKLLGLRWLAGSTIIPETTNEKGLTGFTRQLEGTQMPLALDDVVYFWKPNSEQEVGVGVAPAQVALQAAGMAKYANDFVAGFFERGAIPAVLLTVEGNPSPQELTRLEQWWKKLLHGVRTAWETVAVRAVVKPQIITPPIRDLIVPEIGNAARHQICAALGVPVTLLEDAANYATATSHRRSFYEETIFPESNLIQSAMNEQMFEQMGLRFKFLPEQLEIMQEDEAQRADALGKLTTAGIPLKAAMIILGYDLTPEVEEMLVVAEQRTKALPEPQAGNTVLNVEGKHYGPGPHRSGSPQSVYGRKRGGQSSETAKGFGATTQAFGQDPRRKYEFRYRVIDLDDAITSNTDAGGINSRYAQDLQPRERSRTASQVQIDNVARNLVPESILWDFHQLDKGAPIIGDDMMVESGNGRMLALRRAREQYPESWQEYQSKMRGQLKEAGMSDADLVGVKSPVLVRERVTQVDRTEFAREANSASVLQMSPLETARLDAARIKHEWVTDLSVGEDESIDQALRARRNQSFVSRFTGSMPDNERASLMRGDGTLNQMGLWRMKAAVFAKVFPGESGDRISETFLESLDSTTKNFESSISRSLPRLAQAESMIASGSRHKVSIMEDTSKALDMLSRLRESKIKVGDYLMQGAMFDRELSPRQERLLAHFDKIGGSPVKIREFFNEYADAVMGLPHPGQGGMFGDKEYNVDDIYAILQSKGVLG